MGTVTFPPDYVFSGTAPEFIPKPVDKWERCPECKQMCHEKDGQHKFHLPGCTKVNIKMSKIRNTKFVEIAASIEGIAIG